MNSIMRIRINGPEIDKMNTLPLAKLWLKQGHILTDSKQDPFPRKWPTDDLINSDEFRYEFDDEGKEILTKSNVFYNL